MATSKTVFDNIRDIVDKVGASSSLSDNALKEMAFKYITASEQVYTLDRISASLYKWIGNRHLFLYGATFTETGGVTYTIHANATIEVTAGTESRTSIAVTGAPIRFYAFAAEVCMYLGTQQAQKGTVSAGATSLAMQSVRAELQAQAAYYAQMDEMYGV